VLDRAAATVRFSRESAAVHETAPMAITGSDGKGHTASPAQPATASPALRPRTAATAPGTPATRDLSTGRPAATSDSLPSDPATASEGAEPSEDGMELTVPGEGSWRIDPETGEVEMTPAEGFTGASSPVGVLARGVYADNLVHAAVDVVVSPVVATP